MTLAEAATIGAGRAPDLLAVDDALHTLARLDRRKAVVVEMRFFAGLTVDEVAQALDLSPKTVGREWRRAKAWLFHELTGGQGVAGEC